MDGETLHAAIRRRKRIPVDEALDITRQLAGALAHAHSHGVVHRDIKPGNVLLSPDGLPRLTDYGLAKGESDDALTQVDATLGTPQYIAPEQARNPRDADIRSDIYSLGATLYAMLAGRPPFSGATVAATLTKVLYQRPDPLHEVAPGITTGTGYVVARMMAKDRDYRYASPDELLRDLEALKKGKLHVPLGFRGDIVEFVEARRQRRQWLSVAAVVLAGTALAVGVTWWGDRQETLRIERAAKARFEAIQASPGDPQGWTRGTVEGMVERLEDYLKEYPTSPVRGVAAGTLEKWREQADALERVNVLARKVAGHDGPWPPLLAEHARELRALRSSPDASVATSDLVALTERARALRDQAAEKRFGAALAQARTQPLSVAAARLSGLPKELQEHYFGASPSDVAAQAEDLARRFREADERLDAHFAVYDRAAADEGRWLRGEFLILATLLSESRQDAETDTVLRDTLEALPPLGERSSEVRTRLEARESRLREACEQRKRQVFARADRELRGLRFGNAIQEVRTFADNAVGPAREEASALIARIEEQQTTARASLEDAVETGVWDLFQAVGARTYSEAALAMDRLETAAAAAPEFQGPALELTASARRLLALLESRAWDALRAHLRDRRPSPSGLKFRSIRYPSGQAMRLVGDHVEVDLGGSGEVVSYPLTDVALEDLLRYSRLDPEDPEEALVAATLVLTEFRQPADPRDVPERLAGVERHLERAGTVAALAPCVERLRGLWRRHLALAEAGAREAEADAKFKHDAAREAAAAGNHAEAVSRLENLLESDRTRHTNYVLGQRQDLQHELAVAREALEAQGYADAFRGFTLRSTGRDTASLHADFEDPEAEEILGLEPGVTGLVTRAFMRPDLAASFAGPAPTVRPGSVLAWSRWDGQDATHPRHFPVAFDCPFLYRRPITVSFLYRTDAPYAFFVSICGATAGVLSAPDDREGGLGVQIWHADDLSAPERAFGKQHRPAAAAARGDPVAGREGEFFGFETGRVYRVKFVKEENRARLFVDGRLLASSEVTRTASGSLAGRIVLLSYTSGEVDDLTVEGILDPQWKRRRK